MKAVLGRLWPWLALAVMAVCVLACNVFCVPAHDELSYAFAGQCTPLEGDCPRVSSLGDIVRQQWGDYLRGTNGRVFVHGVVAAFAVGLSLRWMVPLLRPTRRWLFA